MRLKRIALWLIPGLTSLLGVARAVYSWRASSAAGEALSDVGYALILALSAILGALIVTHRPGNRVGWLMVSVSLLALIPTPLIEANFQDAPESLTPGLWLALVIDNLAFWFLIVPFFLILLHFPDGHPPSPRWNWVNAVSAVTLMIFTFFTMFSTRIGPDGGTWAVANPYGFVSEPFDQTPGVLAGLGLLATMLGSTASIVVRFRRAGSVEREQIKWLMSAGVFFFLAFAIALVFATGEPGIAWWGILLLISMLALPLAIAVAILRYHLYDIDLIIRKTLQYLLLTGTLGLVYFGGITLLQDLFTRLVGRADSPLITVISTLGIAVLFSPLRARIQEWIDRRFYRAKYNRERTLFDFARTARDEVDLERLTGSLLEVIDQTLKPDSASLWLKDPSGQLRQAMPSPPRARRVIHWNMGDRSPA